MQPSSRVVASGRGTRTRAGSTSSRASTSLDWRQQLDYELLPAYVQMVASDPPEPSAEQARPPSWPWAARPPKRARTSPTPCSGSPSPPSRWSATPCSCATWPASRSPTGARGGRGEVTRVTACGIARPSTGSVSSPPWRPTKISSAATTSTTSRRSSPITNTDRRRGDLTRSRTTPTRIFTWDYEKGARPALEKLYEKAKTSMWNGETDLPWDTEVDQEAGRRRPTPLASGGLDARDFDVTGTAVREVGRQGVARVRRRVPELDAQPVHARRAGRAGLHGEDRRDGAVDRRQVLRRRPR